MQEFGQELNNFLQCQFLLAQLGSPHVERFPLQHRRRMQKVLFPEGLVYDGEAFRTPVTCLFFRDSAGAEAGRYKAAEIELEKVVARLVPTSNPLLAQLTAFETLGTAAH